MRRIRKHLPLTLAALMIVWGPLRSSGADKKPAVVVVRLPAEAELTIGGVKSKQHSAVREFDTPPLTPGEKFAYRVKAVWKADDKEVRRETTIIVQAGETTEIDLLALKFSPPHAEKLPAPQLLPEMDPKPEPEKKPEPELEPIKKPAPVKRPEKPEPEKKPQPPSTPSKIVASIPLPKGTLALFMPETLNLQPGGRKLLPIKVVRTHCEGPVNIRFEGLPPGVELKNATIAADKQKTYVQATAPAKAEEKEWEVKVIGISGSVRQENTLKIKIAR